MAYITDTSSSFGATLINIAATVANTVVTFLADLTNAASRAHAIEELQAMDDATLKAKHGITRSQIVTYVFQDKILP